MKISRIILAVVFSLMMAVSLVSCKKQTPTDQAVNQAGTMEEQRGTEPAMNETITNETTTNTMEPGR